MADVDDFYLAVGKRIRDRRKAKKMTQEDLGKSVNLTRTSIINIEKGRQKLLLHTFVGISETLKIDVQSLCPSDGLSPAGKLDQILDQRPETEQAFVRDAVRSAIKRKENQ